MSTYISENWIGKQVAVRFETSEFYGILKEFGPWGIAINGDGMNIIFPWHVVGAMELKPE